MTVFEVVRVETHTGVDYEVRAGRTYDDGSPRSEADVSVWVARFGRSSAEVSWPSIGSVAPALAAAVAEALFLASAEAALMNLSDEELAAGFVEAQARLDEVEAYDASGALTPPGGRNPVEAFRDSLANFEREAERRARQGAGR